MTKDKLEGTKERNEERKKEKDFCSFHTHSNATLMNISFLNQFFHLPPQDPSSSLSRTPIKAKPNKLQACTPQLGGVTPRKSPRRNGRQQLRPLNLNAEFSVGGGSSGKDSGDCKQLLFGLSSSTSTSTSTISAKDSSNTCSDCMKMQQTLRSNSTHLDLADRKAELLQSELVNLRLDVDAYSKKNRQLQEECTSLNTQLRLRAEKMNVLSDQLMLAKQDVQDKVSVCL